MLIVCWVFVSWYLSGKERKGGIAVGGASVVLGKTTLPLNDQLELLVLPLCLVQDDPPSLN